MEETIDAKDANVEEIANQKLLHVLRLKVNIEGKAKMEEI